MRPTLKILPLVLALPAILAAQSADPPVPPRVLAALRDTLAREYVVPLSADSLRRFPTAEALLASLLDRHTILLSPEGRKDFNVQTGQSFGGIGASLGLRRDTSLIISVQPGSPAERARLKPFDRIVAVGGKPVVGLSTDSIVSLIRGPAGTPIGLGLRRGLAGEAIQAVIIRAPVQIPSVPAGAMLPNGIGVVRVAQFGPETTREAVEAVDWMVQNQAKGVILDLRDNPGGVLDEALGMAALFVPVGTAMVDVRGRPRTGVNERPTSGQPPRYPTLPLAVMVNENSASAAEVLAGALQESRRALLAGRQSFGKGSVQHVADLPDGWAVKLTIARWYTPSGRRIDRGPQPAGATIDPTAPHEGGVVPDIVLPADTAPALVAQAAIASGPRWDSLNLAMLDWVQAMADTASGLTREFAADSQAVRALVAGSGALSGLPPGTESALLKYVGDALSRGVIGARFGVMEDGAWSLMHDAEVRVVAERLAGAR